jgi:uncharacterized protein YkwD
MEQGRRMRRFFVTRRQASVGAIVVMGAALLGACAGDNRRNNGLGAVNIDPALMQMAQEQARAMATSNKLGHDVNGTFKSRLARAGFADTLAVENVSAGYHTLAEAFSGWRDSAPHRANMLQNGVTRMGIAAVYSPTSKYKVFWTLVLAGPEEQRG